jgi:dihydrofolate reductase
MIVAYAKGTMIIGLNGQIPWRIPSDMKRFKELTVGTSCIMGPNNFRSFPPKFQPLPDRENIIVSRSLTSADFPEGVKVFTTIEEAIAGATFEKISIIGGEPTYQMGMQYADTIEATIVDYGGPGDKYFPLITAQWDNINNVGVNDLKMDEKSSHPYAFVTFKKNGKILVEGDE